MQITPKAISDVAWLSRWFRTGFFISIYQVPFPTWLPYYSHFSAVMTEHSVGLGWRSPSPRGPRRRTDRKDIHFCVTGVMSIFLSTCNFRCSSLFACCSRTILPTWHAVSRGPFSSPTLQPRMTTGIQNEREPSIPTWWHRKRMMKVNDEPGFDVLFRNLALLPWGCSPEDRQDVTIGNPVMGRWKRIVLNMPFFPPHEPLCTCSGVKKGKT